MNGKRILRFGTLLTMFLFLLAALFLSTGGYSSQIADRVALSSELKEADHAVAGAHRSIDEYQAVEASLAPAEQALAEDTRKSDSAYAAASSSAPAALSGAREEDSEEEPATLVHAEELSRDPVAVRTVLAKRGEETAELSLPGRFGPLPERTPFTISFSVIPGRARDLLLQFSGMPVQVYVNDVLFYSGGEEGSYPSILKDPPAEVFTLPLPDTDQEIPVRIELVSPGLSKTVELLPPQIGTEEALIHYQLKRYGITMMISLLFLLAGAACFLLSLGFLNTENGGVYLRCPGEFAVCYGIWLLCSNPLSLFLFRRPALLHVFSYTGMFFQMIPLLLFSIHLMELEGSRFLKGLLITLNVGVTAALLLQITGLVPFAQSVVPMGVLLIASLLALIGVTLKEALSGQNRLLVYYFFALLILLFSSLLYWFGMVRHISDLLVPAYEFGTAVFLLLMLIISTQKMSYFFSLKGQNLRLKDELRLMEKVIDAQKARNRMLVEHANSVKKQRHDLRHHLNTMKVLMDEGKPQEVTAYLEHLTDQIPVDRSVTYCDHEIANALLSYYASLAAAEKIQLEIHAQIPGRTPEISDDSLCVIIGNLLENAVESCRRMTGGGQRFIRFNTKAQGNMLFIAQDNSYEKEPSRRDGYFLSSKRDEVGTGLLSVQSVAERYGGKAYFEAKDGRFRSEVYVHM